MTQDAQDSSSIDWLIALLADSNCPTGGWVAGARPEGATRTSHCWHGSNHGIRFPLWDALCRFNASCGLEAAVAMGLVRVGDVAGCRDYCLRAAHSALHLAMPFISRAYDIAQQHASGNGRGVKADGPGAVDDDDQFRGHPPPPSEPWWCALLACDAELAGGCTSCLAGCMAASLLKPSASRRAPRRLPRPQP